MRLTARAKGPSLAAQDGLGPLGTAKAPAKRAELRADAGRPEGPPRAAGVGEALLSCGPVRGADQSTGKFIFLSSAVQRGSPCNALSDASSLTNWRSSSCAV